MNLPVAAPFRSQTYTIEEVDTELSKIGNLLRLTDKGTDLRKQYIRRANQWLDVRNELENANR